MRTLLFFVNAIWLASELYLVGLSWWAVVPAAVLTLLVGITIAETEAGQP